MDMSRERRIEIPMLYQALNKGDNRRNDRAPNLLDAYELPRNRVALFGEAKHIPKKIAIVRPHDQHRDFWDFYETTARNSGLMLREFDSLNEARKWCMASGVIEIDKEGT